MSDNRNSLGFGFLRAVGVVGSLAVVTGCITIVFLAMRSVMDVGGFCAQGGPYVIETPCPAGVPGLLMGGICVGLVAAFLYAQQAAGAGAVNLTGLLWPAVVHSLGWNFLEYGISPPLEGGLAWGWLMPGVVFVLMGGLPLLWVVPELVGTDGTADNVPRVVVHRGGAAPGRAAAGRRSAGGAVASAGLVDELERLARLHHSGALSDREYEAAKRRLLEER